MKKGLRVTFTENGPVLDTGSFVTGKEARDQNMIINIATQANSDPTDPTRGSTLVESFIQYGYFSKTFAQHVANFAAMSAKVFHNKNASLYNEPPLNTIVLTADQGPNNRASLVMSTTYEGEATSTTNQLI